MQSNNKKYAFWMVLVFLFFFNICFADDEFDPFNPDEVDPGNANISQYIILVAVFALAFASYKLRKRSE